MKLGVDVGGTHTDAVIIADQQILATFKALTSADVTGGVQQAMQQVIDQAGIDRHALHSVVIGTTSFTNAVVERRHLSRTAAVRIGSPNGAAVPPFSGWPADIRAALGGIYYELQGGHEYDGQQTQALQESELAAVVAALRSDGIRAVAITAPFSTVNNSAEQQAAHYLRTHLPDLDITTSFEIGRLGLLERENAALLNASLMKLARKTVQAFREALRELDISAPFLISQNDGSLVDAQFVERYPVQTFSSGPTNSMRGAAYLCQVQQAIVVDVGGTTADIGMVVDGYPRESNVSIEIGNVLTNLRMPDIIALPIGGGTLVRDEGRQLGPDSVGHRLGEEALCFGGTSLTLTDIMVASGAVQIGNVECVNTVSQQTIERVQAQLRETLQRGIDRIKTDRRSIPLIAVGGGAFIVPQDLHGISEVIYPQHAGVANAIGAALAQVSGQAELLYSKQTQSRESALHMAKNQASERAVQAGADILSIKVIDIEEAPVAYMADGTSCIRVRVIGMPLLRQGEHL